MIFGSEVETTKVVLVREKDKYYLNVTGKYEDNTGVYEVKIPRVRLPIEKFITRTETVNEYNSLYASCVNLCSIQLSSFDPLYRHSDYDLPVLPFESATVEQIEKKYKEMTLEEIEKKLGYPIKIVSEKEEK